VGWLVVAGVVLALFAGLCASADTALLRVSRAGAKELATSVSEPSPPLQAVLAEVPKYIAVLLLVRVAAELTATIFVTAAFVSWFGLGWRPFLISGAIMTGLIYIVAGIVPRTLGRDYASGIAVRAASIMQPVVKYLGPFPALLLGLGQLSGRGPQPDSGPSGEEEDLRGLVDLLERRRVIEPGERKMIHSVFELGDTIAREVMVPRTDMIFVQSGKSLRQALSLALRSGFSRIPVIGDNVDDIVGFAYLKDLARRVQDNGNSADDPVEELMRPPYLIPESKPVDEVLREMQARQVHVAVVIDEYGGTAGLVTIEDILEEIVGEIADEYDREAPRIEELPDGSVRVHVRLPVDDVEELFGVRFDIEDVETVGGLLAAELGRVPIPGATATARGLTFLAEAGQGRRNQVGTVLIQRNGTDRPT
jgi:CBS domain containing-hemolysin-like protein